MVAKSTNTKIIKMATLPNSGSDPIKDCRSCLTPILEVMKKLVTWHDINALKRPEDTSESPDGERGPRRDHELNKPIILIIIMHYPCKINPTSIQLQPVRR